MRNTDETHTADVAGAVDFKDTTANETSDDDDDRQPVYVVSTDDNDHIDSCCICHDRIRLDFLHDTEEWVFVDCVEHEGVPVHKTCYDCVYG